MTKTEKYSRKYYQKNKTIIKEKVDKYYQDNKEFLLAKSNKYYKNNKTTISEYRKKYRKENIEKLRERHQKYYLINKEELNRKQQFYSLKNKEAIKERNRIYYLNNKTKVAEYSKIYYQKNREQINKRRRNNKEITNKKHREKLRTDVRFKLRSNISTLIYRRLKLRLSFKNGKSTWDFLPYTIDELKQHIEKQFESWMSWENWGKGKGYWNIDHIKPDCSFNYKSVNDKEFQKCWALENLRPLDAVENMSKNGKILIN